MVNKEVSLNNMRSPLQNLNDNFLNMVIYSDNFHMPVLQLTVAFS